MPSVRSRLLGYSPVCACDALISSDRQEELQFWHREQAHRSDQPEENAL